MSAVQVVHCVDTEGPLHESLEATFERVNSIFGLDLEPSAALLSQLQAGAMDLGGLEAAVRKVVDPHLLAYNDSWDKLDAMLARIMSPQFRSGLRDSRGGSWVYNWFCVDHVGYAANPRRRDIGHHNIFDHYRAAIGDAGPSAARDGLYFHFHPVPFSRDAHRCATHWWNSSDNLVQVLTRKVIDRGWFPAANRPGFHVTRPDSHWFLEQYIPFDFASQSTAATTEADRKQAGLSSGRFGDWRRAPLTWTPYHPSHDDYQVLGSCRRWITRCLNVGTRYRLLSEDDVRLAFREAADGAPVVLAFTNHDFRDMAPDVRQVMRMLGAVSREYPSVPFVFANAVNAVRDALGLPQLPPCELRLTFSGASAGATVMTVESETPTFGPQPWLALKTVTGTYHHDNFDIDVPFHRWQYVFDADTFPLAALSAIGVAANNAYGTSTVAIAEVPSLRVRTTVIRGGMLDTRTARAVSQ